MGGDLIATEGKLHLWWCNVGSDSASSLLSMEQTAFLATITSNVSCVWPPPGACHLFLSLALKAMRVVCCANDWAILLPSFNLLIWIHIVSTFIFQKATQLLPLLFVPFIWSGTVSRSQAPAHSARRASLMMRHVITTFLLPSGTRLPNTHLPCFTPWVILALVLGESLQDPNVATARHSPIQHRCWSIKVKCLWISSYGLLMCCAVTEDFVF